jgi:hypothetical protein
MAWRSDVAQLVPAAGIIPSYTARYIFTTSVADPGCLFRIPDPKLATKERDEKNLFL